MISILHLRDSFVYQPLHYLTPTHPFFVVIYIFYGLVVVFVIRACIRHQQQRHSDDSADAAVGPSTDARQTSQPRSALSALCPAIVQSSLADVHRASWTDAAYTLVANAVWPFQRFGLLGFPLAIVYLPIVLPLTAALVMTYCLPTARAVIAAVRHTVKTIRRRRHRRRGVGVRLLPERESCHRSWSAELDNGVDEKDSSVFEVEHLLGLCKLADGEISTVESDAEVDGGLEDEKETAELENLAEREKRRRVTQFAFANVASGGDAGSGLPAFGRYATLRSLSMTAVSVVWHQMLFPIFECVLFSGAIVGAAVVTSECVGFLAELLALTAVGVFANAEHLMKYFVLTFLLAVYVRDCFHAVHGRFLMVNRTLFAELKSRVPDLDKVTSLPSYLQQNTAFKIGQRSRHRRHSLAATDDADDGKSMAKSIDDSGSSNVDEDDHSIPDELMSDQTVSSLVLFVDRYDKPMIPRQLFDQVSFQFVLRWQACIRRCISTLRMNLWFGRRRHLHHIAASSSLLNLQRISVAPTPSQS